MTEAEVRDWLSVPPEVELRPELIEGMSLVVRPYDDVTHMRAWGAFLACAGRTGAVERRAEP